MEEEKEFGDFEEIKEENSEEPPQLDSNTRVRRPRDNEKIGIILQRLGGNRMNIKSTDGKTRNCRVPGKYRRQLWLRPRDIVLIKPWEDDDSKGDVIYKYPPVAVHQLKKKGIINDLKDEF